MGVSPELSIVIGSFNRRPFLVAAIESVRRELTRGGLAAEIIVVDGGSVDGSLQWLIRQKDIVTISQHNHGEWRGRPIVRRSWGYFMNLAFKAAQGRYVCMLSDDCMVVPGAIRNGYELAESERRSGRKLGGVAFYWRNWPEQQKYSVFRFYGVLNVNHGLYLREALAEVGHAEEELYRFYYGDVDLAFKLDRAGYAIIPSPTSFIEHYMHVDKQGRAENFRFDDEDGRNFIDRWQKVHGLGRFAAENRAQVDSIEFSDPQQTSRAFTRPGMLARLLGRFKCEK
ncbi:glycosyltransferase family 2 protein [Desulfuromonas sp. TF]|uniref:glycosyltransferase family 2 protein n=1 Tax=Desulfuromonas sp. TF TaxID=1232410 RepID=UPI00041F9F39|nr:glycosyltransferase [Desulfuromonas sp. TF]